MNTQQLEAGFLDLQSAIYGVALSLDAFLLNGIQYGVLQRVVFDDFLQKTALNLLRDLDSLDEHAERTSPRPVIADILTAIRARCQQVIDLVTSLSSFRSLPLPQVRLAVSRITPMREDCIWRIQELEALARTPKPFYRSRSEHSTAAIDDFLSGLERAFVEEWTASNSVDTSA